MTRETTWLEAFKYACTYLELLCYSKSFLCELCLVRVLLDVGKVEKCQIDEGSSVETDIWLQT